MAVEPRRVRRVRGLRGRGALVRFNPAGASVPAFVPLPPFDAACPGLFPRHERRYVIARLWPRRA